MSRITLEEFVEENELNEISDLPEEELAEQEQSSQAETAAASQETEELIENQERSIDTVEALESLREAMESKGQLSETDLKLMRIATEMAVAGTGISITSVIPALESNDPMIALEGFGDRIKQIIQSIGRNIARIWRSIKNVISKFMLSFRTLEGRVKKLLAKARSIKASKGVTAENLSIKFRDIFIVDLKRVKDLVTFKTEILKSVKMYDGAIESIFKNASVTSKEYGVLATLKDLTKIEETGTKFYKQIQSFTNDMIKDLGLKKHATINQMDIYVSESGVSNGGIEVRIPKSKATDYASMKATVHMFDLLTLEDTDSAMAMYDDKDGAAMKFERVKIDSVIEILDSMYKYLISQNKYFRRYDEMANSATVAADRAIHQTVMLLGGLLATGVNAAGFAINPAVAAVGGAIAGSIPMIMKELLFSYKAMSKNNDVTFHALNKCFWDIDSIITDTTWACADILNKGRWQ